MGKTAEEATAVERILVGCSSTDLVRYSLRILSVRPVSPSPPLSSTGYESGAWGIQSEGFVRSYWAVLVPILGILVSLLWYQSIQSHSDLNTVKFQIIRKLEEHLPVALYAHDVLGGADPSRCTSGRDCGRQPMEIAVDTGGSRPAIR